MVDEIITNPQLTAEIQPKVKDNQKFGTLCLQLCTAVTALTLSAGTSKLITSSTSKTFHPPRYLSPCASESTFADIVRIYKFHLLTYNRGLSSRP